jgi:hypothetical protein
VEFFLSVKKEDIINLERFMIIFLRGFHKAKLDKEIRDVIKSRMVYLLQNGNDRIAQLSRAFLIIHADQKIGSLKRKRDEGDSQMDGFKSLVSKTPTLSYLLNSNNMTLADTVSVKSLESFLQ